MSSKSSRQAKIVGWFRETISSFLDASLIFAVAILVAAIYRFTSAFRDSDQLDNAFPPSLWNAIIVALLSVFPPLILQCTSSDSLRRKGLRVLLWFLVVVFTITSNVLFFIWYKSLNPNTLRPTRAGGTEYLWTLCTKDLPGRNRQSLGFVIAAQAQLLLNLMFWTYTRLPNSDIVQDRKCSKRGRSVLQTQARAADSRRNPRRMLVFQILTRALQVLSAQLMMWLLLGLLTSLTLSDGVNAGESFKNSKWSVGQVLGLAQFVPVIIDLVVASICEYSCLSHYNSQSLTRFKMGPRWRGRRRCQSDMQLLTHHLSLAIVVEKAMLLTSLPRPPRCNSRRLFWSYSS